MTRSWNITHIIEEDTYLAQLTGPNHNLTTIHHQEAWGPGSILESNKRLFYAFALSELEGGYINGIHGPVFYCMQFLVGVFAFGEAIQWTTDHPQGHNAERGPEKRHSH